MTGDDRLRSELEALESAAPADLPPRPSRSRAPSWPRIAAALGVIVAAGVVLRLTLPAWLENNGPLSSARPTASGSDTAEPTASETAELEWTAVPFPDRDRDLVQGHLTAVDGRLIVTGGSIERPAAWYSDDGGATWVQSQFEVVVPAIPGYAVKYGPMGAVVQRNGELFSPTVADASSYERPLSSPIEDTRTSRLIDMWKSSDRGATWTEAAGPPAFVRDLAAGEEGIAAVRDDNPPGPIIWFSDDGHEWKAADGATFADAHVAAAAHQRGRFVAVGSTSDGADAAIWESVDGHAWDAVSLPAGYGRIVDVGAGAEGFVAVGHAASPGGATVLWRSADGVTWTPSALTLESDWVPELPVEPLSLAVGSRGVIVTGTLLQLRVSNSQSWLVAPGSSEGSVQNIGFVVDVAPHQEGFIALTTCPPPADCPGWDLAFGQPAGFDPPAPTLKPEP